MSIHTPPSTYILRDIVDVAVPESVAWWPQTIGWQILALVILMACFVWGYRRIKVWWQNRYRREALQALATLDLGLPRESATSLLTILKAVLVYLEPQNAALFGDALLQKLDSLLPSATPSSVKGDAEVKPAHHADLQPDLQPDFQSDFQSNFQYQGELGKKWLAASLSSHRTLTEPELATLIEHTRTWLLLHRKPESISASNKGAQ
ncbi:DUF4381 domain-containing protein [Photobacterium sanguinicancri]|uniref:DUF4381 domain-containing protein n=1 Tax=Photobacterium sanguinicancri TaxID=875932 RepID=A0ABX4FX70_9GAMM|nr:DUF4381 domain-containing protein [Photobacterium sanguinicancri]OZS43414.1 hypothetical protein ASV53_13335 [Photobacterium sanguinicancri]